MAGAWNVVHESVLLELMRRAHEGEDPDLLMAEHYANADTHEYFEEED